MKLQFSFEEFSVAVGALFKFEIGIAFLFLAVCLFTVDHNNFINSERYQV